MFSFGSLQQWRLHVVGDCIHFHRQYHELLVSGASLEATLPLPLSLSLVLSPNTTTIKMIIRPRGGQDIKSLIVQTHSPAAGAKTIGSSHGGAVDASSATAGGPKARRVVRLKGVRWTPPRSRQGGPKATSAQHQLSALTLGTVGFPPRSCRGV